MKVIVVAAAAVGDGRLSTAAEDLATYAYDGTWAEARPDVVVHPEATAQVAAVLRVAGMHLDALSREPGIAHLSGDAPVHGSMAVASVSGRSTGRSFEWSADLKSS